MKVDAIIVNSSAIATLKSNGKPLSGRKMNDVGLIRSSAVAIINGKIFDVDKEKEIIKKYKPLKWIDAEQGLVTPGFVDPHTHLVFAGDRVGEFYRKLKGEDYLNILKSGGGILETVTKTRAASEKALLQEASFRLNKAFYNGTTTIEIKSGYGLTTKSELKILKVINKLNKLHPVDVIPTFMGAHAIPFDRKKSDYIEEIINEMLPVVASKKLAEFCDVFCEKGVFELKDSKKILIAGKKYGLKPKLHADELYNLNGTALAAEVSATSADHLLMAQEAALKKMKKAGVIPVLLPGTAFFLDKERFASARMMIDKLNLPLALATDCNPGTSMIVSMAFIMSLACIKMKMTAQEALAASTINAAFAISRGNIIGSIEKGKQADILIHNVKRVEDIPYNCAESTVKYIIKKGQLFVKSFSDYSYEVINFKGF